MPFLGIDVGTSGCKAAVIGNNGIIQHMERTSYDLRYPGMGLVELDLAEVWVAVKQVLKRLAPHCDDVQGVAVSSIGETMVLLDDRDNVLTNGIIYLDRRCQDVLKYIEQKIDVNRLYQITGLEISQMHSLCRYIWYQQNCPEILDKAKYILLVGEYIGYMLTGERGTDVCTASKTMMFDVLTHRWSDHVMNTFGVRKELFSPILKPGALLGYIRPALAGELGLSKKLKVFEGCHDQCASVLGGGAVETGEIVSSQGSSEGFNMIMDASCLDGVKSRMGLIQPYVIDNLYLTSRGQLSHGTCIRWFAQNIERDLYLACKEKGENIYQILDTRCAEDSGEVLFFPYLSRVSIREDGLRKGALGGFLGVDVGATKPMLYRALLEGLSFETKRNFDWMKKNGIPIRNLSMVGGGAASDLFMQMKADIINQPLKILQSPESGIAGLGMIISVALGEFNNYYEAVSSFVRIKRLFVPKKDYSEKYVKYSTLSKVIKEVYQHI